MLVRVKEHPTEPATDIRISGPAAKKIVSDLQQLYKDSLLIENDEEDYVNVRDVPWIQKEIEAITPGKRLKIYRDNRGMSLGILAELSGIPKGNLSKMEHDTRPSGKHTAVRLAKALNCDFRSLL